MSLEIVTETGGFQKDFDIPCLAVADDKKRIFFPKFLQGMFQPLIERSCIFLIKLHVLPDSIRQ